MIGLDLSPPASSPVDSGSLRNWLHGALECVLASMGVSTTLPRRNRADPGVWVQWGVTRPHLQSWLCRSLRVLDGAPPRGSDVPPAQLQDLWSDWERRKPAWLHEPGLARTVQALDAAWRHLPDIVQGKIEVEQVLPAGFGLDWIGDGQAQATQSEGAVLSILGDYLQARAEEASGGRIRILHLAPAMATIPPEVRALLVEHGSRIAEYRWSGSGESVDGAGLVVPFRWDPKRPLYAQEGGTSAFDVVIASNALHRARDVRAALHGTKAALKENGILIVDEVGGFDLAAHMTIGLTAGWWDYDDGDLRVDGSPAVTARDWLGMLEREGFRDAFALHEDRSALNRHVLVAESDGVHGAAAAAVSMAGEPSARPRGASAAIAPQPLSVAAPSGEAVLDAVTACVRDTLISVLRLDAGDLRDEVNFATYGVDSLTSAQIINRIGGHYAIRLPATLLFDFSTVASLSNHLAHTFHDEVGAQIAPARSHAEPAAMAAGVEFAALAAAPAAAMPPHAAAKGPAGPDRLRRVVIDRPGEITDIRIVSEDLPPLGASDVRIEVRAFSLNFGDLLCIKGLYPTMPPYPFTPGMEVSGVVLACGASVTTVAAGDEVVATTGASFGGHATIVTCEAHQLWRKPASLSFEDACSLPIAGMTMLEVFRRAQLKSGERILIQTAAGGAGLVAVQLARHIGAEVFATAGTAEKLDYLVGIGVPHAINYVSNDFEAEVLRLTGGRGVDVVINTLAGDAIQKGLNCLAPGGRYVEIAMTGLKGARALDLSVLNDNQSFHSVDLRKQVKNAPHLVADLLAELSAWVERGVIRPVVGAVVPFDDVRQAYRLLEDRRNIGKVVVSVPAAAAKEQAQAAGAAETPLASHAALPAAATHGQVGTEAIAVIGMSGRFPKSADLDALWAHLAAGEDLTEAVTRWDLPHLDGTAGEWRSGLIDGIDQFDPDFFGITDIEALYMDPQQRLFLEEAWSALEDAGYVGAAISQRQCGVYVGAASVDYAGRTADNAPPQAFWGNVGSVIPARIAYHLDLQGPAVAVDTACSSSLVAIHGACQALWLGEVDMALAGGVFLQPGPAFMRSSIAADMVSPTGRCHAFDARANGFVPGEGVGLLVLKRLADAIADGDHICGVIRGIGINQDGTTSGITAPSGRAQSRLQRAVYDRFGIDAGTIQMVEAHGTGTRLGDPIEVRALTEAFGDATQRRDRCAIGSVKTNLGHTVTAAGVTGVLKVLLSLRNRQMPPSLHYDRGNPEIDLEASPFFVNTALRHWPDNGEQPRRAAVSSFGFSGTNAHAVIEEAPATTRKPARRPAYLLALSARTPAELRTQAKSWVRWSENHRGAEAMDVSFTLLQGRRHFDHRLALVVRSLEEAEGKLRMWLSGQGSPFIHLGDASGLRKPGAASDAARARACLNEVRGTPGADAYSQGLDRIAGMFVRGVDVPFGDLFEGQGAGRVPLPSYPFTRRSFWVESEREDVRAPLSEIVPPAAVAREETGPAPQLLMRRWSPVPPAEPASPMTLQRHWVFLDPALAPLQPRLSVLLPDADIDLLAPEGGMGAADLLAGAVERIAARIVPAMQARPRERLLVQVAGLVDGDAPSWLYALSGMFRSVGLEQQKLSGQVIGAEGVVGSAEAWADRLLANAGNLTDHELLYRASGERLVADLEPDAAPQPARAPWQDGGVYLITGGGGGLGRIFATDIADRCRPGSIVLAGRSPQSDEVTAFIAGLRAEGVAVEYRSADMSDGVAVNALVAGIVRDHGSLSGVIHGAGVVHDEFLIRKGTDQIRQVLAAKARGAEHLDHATRDLQLDLFVCFSSIAASLGNAGQSDYAAANAFLDRFAEHRAALVARGARHGRTLSVAWPLWADGGMGRDGAARALWEDAGLTPLQSRQGLDTFYGALASGQGSVVVMPAAFAAAVAPTDQAAALSTAAPLSNRLKALIHEVTLVATDRLAPQTSFESLGIDSLMIARLHARLVMPFPDLPKTAFFECPRIGDLETYLVSEFPAAAAAWCAAAGRSQAAASAGTPAVLAGALGTEDRASSVERADEGIAIIGLAGRYPQARNLDQFWNNLAAGRDSITPLRPERWSTGGGGQLPRERAFGESYCQAGGFLDGFADFDPLFFGIAPSEALSMDPQERLFLQECWHAMEDAGYTREALRRRHGQRVGVFAGVSKTGYALHGPVVPLNGQDVHLHTSFSSVANRVSYVLDLTGPSVAVDTMCSASLTAVHQACESLARGECEMAFAGGVNLHLHPSSYAMLCAAGMLSRSGVNSSFGAGADGFVPGEGVGAILLKPLARALADGDPVHAVIRASSINHGGHTHGYTVPNPHAQRALVRDAIGKAGLRPRDITYVEAHGTGTPLGDPIEIASLSQAFADDDGSEQPIPIGSVKSNIGHLEAAAGIAGLTKVVLQMRHGRLVPSLHSETLNPDIRIERTPFRVQRALSDWALGPAARIAGISSFGAGGANAHIILQDHADTRGARRWDAGAPVQIILSARSDDRLRAMAERLSSWLDQQAPREADLADIAYTLQVGREPMRVRLAVEGVSASDLSEALLHYARTGVAAGGLRLGGGSVPDKGGTSLLDHWLAGGDVDWAGAYPDGTPRRVSVPGYAFAEETYWPSRSGAEALAAPVKTAATSLMFPVWQHQPSPDRPNPPPGQDGATLLVTGDVVGGDEGSFSHVLRLSGHSTEQDFADALAACGPLDHVVWRASASGRQADGEALLGALRDGALSCFRLLKALLRLGYAARPFRFTLLTQNAVAVTADEISDPAQAALHGILGAAAKEYPGWHIQVVDLDERDTRPIADVLSIPSDPVGECTAVRDGASFRQQLVRGDAGVFGDPPLRRGGVYVVIGGAGHVGAAFSERLIRDWAAQVIWIGRRPMDAVLAEQLDRVASHGPRPVYFQADARDLPALAGAARQVRERFGRIDGIVHSAIVLADGSLAAMDEQRFLSALSAKADSCVRMAQAFAEDQPDFFLFFSSLASFGKLGGQSNYAAGCLFADAFAHRLRRTARVPVKVVNWGNWEVIDGKAVSGAVRASMARTGVGALSADEGIDGLLDLLGGPFDQVGLLKRIDGSEVEAERRPATTAAARGTALSAVEAVQATEPSLPPRPVIGMPNVRPQVRDVLIDRLREALGLTTHAVAADEPLAAYGVDSITGTRFIQLVNKALGTELEAKAIYDHPTIDALTRHVLGRFGDTLALPADPKGADTLAVPPAAVPQPGSVAAAPAHRHAASDAVAVVGMAARFPGAPDASALWQHLLNGVDLVAGTSRWAARDPDGQAHWHGGFLKEIDLFDPLFFGITRAEARFMDPQQRIFLEEAWHALEDAGYAGAGLRGMCCGVYAGHNGSDYHQLFNGALPPQALWGNAASILPARIAYRLDLQGPAMTVDTACSSSLVAIHLACKALQAGDIDLALAGGAQVYCTPSFHVAAGKAGMLSATGRCHSFDQAADGFVPAEGAGVLVLKRLDDALAARDHIYGVIRGSAINQDGASNGITAPNGPSQARLERTAYQRAGVRPRDIGMVEAHGTGTRLGDPIEVGALTSVFGEDTDDTGFCALGSIKTNIGHALAAAGVAGTIKALLSLKHARIPASLNYRRANRDISFQGSPFFVPDAPVDWPQQPGRPRIAAVSSFGFSGTNAHLVLEEAPAYPDRQAASGPHLVTLSAKAATPLRELVQDLLERVAADAPDCRDLSYTLAVGRDHFAHRLAFVVDDAADLRRALADWLDHGGLASGRSGVVREKDRLAHEDETGPAEAAARFYRDVSGDPSRRRSALFQLGDLYTKGYPVPFAELFAGSEAGRIPLPVYPFQHERCWFDQAVVSDPIPAAAAPPPTIEDEPPAARRVTLTLDAEDRRIGGHVVDDVQSIPGIVCLDLVREALSAVPAFAAGADLGNVLWLRPILLDAATVKLAIDARPLTEGRWAFEVRRAADDAPLCARGEARPAAARGQTHAEIALADPDGDLLPVSVSHLPARVQSVASGRERLLARFAAAEGAQNREDGLQPFLEAVLQVLHQVRGADAKAASQPAAIPLLFSVDHAPAPETDLLITEARVRLSEAEDASGFTVDMDFTGESGAVLAQLRGLRFRRPRAAAKPSSIVPAPLGDPEPVRALTLAPLWQQARLAQPGPGADMPTTIIATCPQAAAWASEDVPDARIIMLRPGADAGLPQDLAGAAKAGERIICCLHREHPFEGGPVARPAVRMLRIAKALLGAGGADARLDLVVVTQGGAAVLPGEIADADQAAVQGLVGCLAKEQAEWRVIAADLPQEGGVRLSEILRLPPNADGDVLAMRDGRWWQRRFASQLLEDSPREAFRNGGVYVVIGGAGALGDVLSEHLIRTRQARLFWIGRRPLNGDIQARMDRLGALGPEPRYLQADARNRTSLKAALDTIARDHPFIDGLIHSALVMSGSDVAHMTEAQFADGFLTKADICDHLAEICAPGSVGAVLFFSSIQSWQRTERQANYAAGCAYKDAAAPALAARLGCPVKIVNWGYWGSVGKAAGLKSFQNWLKQAGMGSIEPEEGMALLERFVASPIDQLAFVKLREGAQLRGVEIVEGGGTNGRDASPSLMAAMPAVANPALTAAILAETEAYPTDEFEWLLGRMLFAQVQALHPFDTAWVEGGDWQGAAGIIDLYRPWADETLRALARLGYLERDGNHYRRGKVTAGDRSVPWQAWETEKEAWRSFPQMSAFFSLVEQTLRNLPGIVLGRTMVTEVIFPGSSLHLVEPIYKNNAIADYFNAVLAHSLVRYVEERARRDPEAKVRILEVGAGTGGTTASLIARLAPQAAHIADYRYTDLSKAFLSHAERQYLPQAPYLSFGIFDVESEPAAQGLLHQHFDVVVAANVLHATHDIRRTLAHVDACLKPGGLLMLNEMSQNSLFSHLTFGLLKGWWLSDDPDLRVEGSPVVAQETWRTVLADIGFDTILFPTELVTHLGQQIVVAQKHDPSVTAADVRPDAADPAPLVIPADPQPQPALGTGGDERREEVRRAIVEQVSQALELDPYEIDHDMPFADYGLDSIVAIATVDALNDRYGLDLTSTTLFEKSSVNLLTDFVLDKLPVAPLKPAAFVPPVRQEAPAARREMPAAPPPTPSKIAEPQPAPAETSRQPQLAHAGPEPIAIVGISGRFGGAESPDELWATLAEGREQIEPVTRWDLEQAYGVAAGAEGYCWHGSFVRDIDRFDPGFFNISGIEATYMDPQQRLFLEEAWKALEDGGYAGAAIAGQRCGVYAGQNGEDYRAQCSGEVPPQAMWGNAGAILSARISYFLNLKGPAITVDTACSSSLVAVHLACQGLRLRETDMAIAGGVTARCTPEFYQATATTRMVSPTGRCRPFDAAADGFVPGEAVGALLLKRLDDAVADGDHIYAVIRGSCLNQDGATNGITAPNAASQEQLHLETYRLTSTDPARIQLVEAHGTGTSLGDPIEHEALTRAFRQHTDRTNFCALGSVKANIGHTTAAAGVSSIVKVVLALKHRQLPPAPGFSDPNPRLDMAGSPFFVNMELRPWLALDGGPRCAVVSSFGISGTNAHLVLEEAPEAGPSRDMAPAHLIALSARSDEQLRTLLARLVAHCEGEEPATCCDISYTLLTGRRHLQHRLAMVVRDTADLIAKGRDYLNGGRAAGVYAGSAALASGEPSMLAGFGNRCMEECAAGLPEADYVQRLRTVAELFVQRQPLDFMALFAGRPVRRVPLPTYPFARERYWAEPVTTAAAALHLGPSMQAAPAVPAPAQTPVPAAPRSAHARAVDVIVGFVVDELRIGRDTVDPQEDIQVYGIDSLIGMRLVRMLEAECGAVLSYGELLERSSINDLASLVVERSTVQPSSGNGSHTASSEQDSERRAAEVLAQYNEGVINLEQTEALLRSIALG